MTEVLTVVEMTVPYCFARLLDLRCHQELAGAVVRLEAAERTGRYGARPLIYLMSSDGEADPGSSTEHGLARGRSHAHRQTS